MWDSIICQKKKQRQILKWKFTPDLVIEGRLQDTYQSYCQKNRKSLAQNHLIRKTAVIQAKTPD